MAVTTRIRWGNLTSLTVTNLESLVAGNVWQSGVISNPVSPDIEVYVRVWYHCIFNTTPVAGDSLNFHIAEGDDDGTEIWMGGIGESESEISTAATIAAIEAAIPPVHVHPWVTSHGTTFKGKFIDSLVGPEWQILIKAVGEALTTGNVVKYQYGTPRSV